MRAPEEHAERFPQHARFKSVSAQHRVVEDFVSFIECTDGLVLCRENSEGDYMQLYPRDIEKLIAEYLEIDYDAFMQEKEDMYEELAAEAATHD